MFTQPPNLILASTSPIRRQLLQNAGIVLTCENPQIDENYYKSKFASLDPSDLALTLAEIKAKSINDVNSLVIGADQTLSSNGKLFHKAENRAEARTQLKSLRGQTHTLYSAIAITRANKTLFTAIDKAHLTMRNFSDNYAENYIETCGDEIFSAVGCYQLEKQGAQLFQKIEGDYFTILGFPLLQCLAFLRQIKFLET